MTHPSEAVAFCMHGTVSTFNNRFVVPVMIKKHISQVLEFIFISRSKETISYHVNNLNKRNN